MSRGIGPIATNTATTSLPMAPALPAPGVLKTKFEKHEEEERQRDLAAIGNRSQPNRLGKRILTDDEVIALRKKEAETGWPYKKLRQWFEFYELGDGTLCSLCRGHRRQDLPMFERKRTRMSVSRPSSLNVDAIFPSMAACAATAAISANSARSLPVGSGSMAGAVAGTMAV